MNETTVGDLMSAPPHACRPETDLAVVAALMWSHHLGFVPVVGATGSLVGVITDRDIYTATVPRGMQPEQISVAEAMTCARYTCLPTDDVSTALAVMKQFSVRRLAVVNEAEELQGVVSINDIVLGSDRQSAKTMC